MIDDRIGLSIFPKKAHPDFILDFIRGWTPAFRKKMREEEEAVAHCTLEYV